MNCVYLAMSLRKGGPWTTSRVCLLSSLWIADVHDLCEERRCFSCLLVIHHPILAGWLCPFWFSLCDHPAGGFDYHLESPEEPCHLSLELWVTCPHQPWVDWPVREKEVARLACTFCPGGSDGGSLLVCCFVKCWQQRGRNWCMVCLNAPLKGVGGKWGVWRETW